MTQWKVALLTLVLSSATYAQATRGAQLAAVPAFEDAQLRVHPVSLAPGGRAELRAHADALIIPFGNDLDGRAPLDPVSWHPAGATTLENRGPMPFDALVVELVAPRSEAASSLPPEVTPEAVRSSLLYHRAEGRRVRTVLDNPRVLVTAHRLPDWQPTTEPWHWHSREVVLVYLAGGEIAGSTGQLDARRVRRGDFDVLPANLPHVFQNVGNAPIEFLLIAPK
jgi:hypothetical protein